MTAFKVDENLPVEVATLLRSDSHDAVTVLDERLGGRSDLEVIAACRREKRALITLDLDFANVRAYPPAESDGIVVLRLAQHDKPHVLSVVDSLRRHLAGASVRGQLWVVEETRIRIRE